MILDIIRKSILPAIDADLKHQIARLDETHTLPFKEMLTYHMGWTGEGAGPEAQGKRIRPLLLLLTAASCGIDWSTALPAASSVELIHNFSLVHDDIQDKSERRHGRMTIWKKWGIPLGINSGDALFVLSDQAMLELSSTFPSATVIKASSILHATCLDLTIGQYLDMSYEKREDLTIKDYWPMVSGKTASLLAACTTIGSLLGNADETTQEAYHSFGHYLGLAFQVQDDFLGIWGEPALTGKSSVSDLLTGKKSLPILFGLEQNGEFARKYSRGPVHPEEIPGLAEQLTKDGAKLFTQETADKMIDLAMQLLQIAQPQGEAGQALYGLAFQLVGRQA